MIEVKFRIYNKEDEEMYGDGVAKLLLYKESIGELKPDKWAEYRQYTGLKDKNGVEIYNGDILKTATGSISKVLYKECGFKIKKTDDETLPLLKSICSHSEVIGNIHQNPELLS